ncbi:hypothetical protein [Microcoleus sp. herbarium2]|uniref:hypothetical protein n=1 Tax=Microcoleus sp. herbarium2 TaxID=3055433 RepID=UPI002FD09C91
MKNTKTKEEESSATDLVTDGRKKSEGSRLMEVVKREYFHDSPPSPTRTLSIRGRQPWHRPYKTSL